MKNRSGNYTKTCNQKSTEFLKKRNRDRDKLGMV